MKYLVTGGAGFIGSHLVREALGRGHEVLNLDALTYAANPLTLKDVEAHPSYHFVESDIENRQAFFNILARFQPDVIFNLAAETHVDRSIEEPDRFVRTNVMGTLSVLNAALDYLKTATKPLKILHISTDEVYGSLTDDAPAFTENSPYSPCSPYSASKAASDHLCRAYHHTYALPVIVTNCGNNYGPHQFPEKLIPHMILSALQEKSLPVYARGENIRDWIYVLDHVDALLRIAEAGQAGQTYLIGSRQEKRNIDIVHGICDALDATRPRQGGGSYRDLIAFVADRPGHDNRYALNTAKIEAELGWAPKHGFESAFSETLAWYLQNPEWVQSAFDRGYHLQRMGKDRQT